MDTYKKVVGFTNFKEEYRRAKVVGGCYKGLRNKFALAEKYGVSGLEMFFNCTAECEINQRKEIEVEISPDSCSWGFCEWNLRDVIESLRRDDRRMVFITVRLGFYKENGDRETKVISEFYFIKKTERKRK